MKNRKREAARNRKQVLPYYAQLLAKDTVAKRPLRMPERQHYKCESGAMLKIGFIISHRTAFR